MRILNHHRAFVITGIFLFFSPSNLFSQFSASSILSGTVTTTSVTQGTDWTNPSNVQLSDNVFATSLITGTNKPTYYLDAKNWGFQSSNSGLADYIPPGATVNGIEVFIKLKRSNVGRIKDNKIILLKAGSETGSSKARGNTLWPTTAAEIKFGSNIDLWGGTWTAADLINSGFGIRISAKNRGSKDAQAEIDYIHIKVYFNQIFYYSKSTGNLELTTTWGTNTDGTGLNPSSFTNDGQIFFLQNRITASLTANFTISGINSKIIIGNGSSATTLTIPSNYVLNATADIAAFSALTINNSTNPTLGSIEDNTTVTYGASANQTVQDNTYYNLTLSGTGTKTLQNSVSGLSTINNVLTIASGITFNNQGDNVFIYGTTTGISNAGIATGAGRYVYSLLDVTTNITGTGTFSNLEIDCGTTTTAKTLTLSNATTITGTLYLTDGSFANGSNLTMSSGSTIQLADGLLGSSISSSGYDVIYDGYTTASPKTTANELTGTLRNCTMQTGTGLAINLNRSLVLSGSLYIVSGTLDPTASNYNLTIGADFNNTGTLTLRNNIITFNGSSSQALSGTSSQSFYDMVINNTGGIQMNTPVTINHGLTLTNGNITTTSTNILSLANGSTITGGSSSSYITGPLRHNLSSLSASKFFPIGKTGAYRPVTLSLTQLSASSTNYTAEIFTGAPPSRNLPSGINVVSSVRFCTINCSDNSNVSSAVVTLNYGADDNVVDPTKLRIAKSSGSDWINLGGTGSGSGSGNITSNSFNSFSDFVLGTSFSVLPLKWLSFSASEKNGKIELKWETANEYNVSRFEIERSSNGNDWKMLGTIPGKNQITNQYSFIDADPLLNRNYYRVRSVDLDGKMNYSSIVSVKENFSNKLTIGPNPVTGKELNIIITQTELLTKKEIYIRVFDMSGRSLKKIKIAPQNVMNIPIAHLLTGQYILSITADEIKMKTMFFVQK